MSQCRSLRCGGWALVGLHPALVVFDVAAVAAILRFASIAEEAVSACCVAGSAGFQSHAMWYRPHMLDHRGSCC